MSTTSIGLRVTHEQWKTFRAAAAQDGLTPSDWLRKTAQDKIDAKQQEDRLAALDQRLLVGLQAISKQLDLIYKKINELESA